MIIQCEQGSEEWKSLRLKKISATDASVIMKLNPWVSPEMLMARKKGIIEDEPLNDAMRRGNELEPVARDIYEKLSGVKMIPTVRIGLERLVTLNINTGDTAYKSEHLWAMCSTDGESQTPLKDGNHFCIEIKSGKKAYSYALENHIPDYYLAQIQHILWLTDCTFCHYCAFDGESDLKIIKVFPNREFIENMIEKEYEFYKKMMDESYVP